MAAFVDILDPVDNPADAVERLRSAIADIYQEAWDKQLKPTYKRNFSLNVHIFAQLWYQKALKVFIAYDTQRNPVGFLIGTVYRPLSYDASVFQVETWYARDGEETKNQLFEYASNALRFIGCDEVLVMDTPEDTVPLMPKWKESHRFTMHRYTKE